MAQNTGNAHPRDDRRPYGNRPGNSQSNGNAQRNDTPTTEAKKGKKLGVRRPVWMTTKTIIPVVVGLTTGIGTFLAMRSLIGFGVGIAFFAVVWMALREQEPKGKTQKKQSVGAMANTKNGLSKVNSVDFEKHAAGAVRGIVNVVKAVIVGLASVTRSIVRAYSYMDWTDLAESTIGLVLVLLTTIVPYALGWYAMDMAFYLVLGILVLSLLLVNVFDKDTSKLEWFLYIAGVFAILIEPLLSLKYTYLVTVPGEHIAAIYTDQIVGFGAIASGSLVLIYQFVFRLVYRKISEGVPVEKPVARETVPAQKVEMKTGAHLPITTTAIQARMANTSNVREQVETPAVSPESSVHKSETTVEAIVVKPAATPTQNGSGHVSVANATARMNPATGDKIDDSKDPTTRRWSDHTVSTLRSLAKFLRDHERPDEQTRHPVIYGTLATMWRRSEFGPFSEFLEWIGQHPQEYLNEEQIAA